MFWLVKLLFICGIFQVKIITSHEITGSETSAIALSKRHYKGDVLIDHLALHNLKHSLKVIHKKSVKKAERKLEIGKNHYKLPIAQQINNEQDILLMEKHNQKHPKNGFLKPMKGFHDFISFKSKDNDTKETEEEDNHGENDDTGETYEKDIIRKIDRYSEKSEESFIIKTQNCPSDGFFPDIHSCKAYHYCSEGKDYPFQCEKHLVYSPQNKSCAKKNKKTKCFKFRCKHRFKGVPYEGDPNIYTLCRRKKPTLIFRCPNGLIFYESSQSCLPSCHKKLFIDPEDCTRFYRCEGKHQNSPPIGNRCPLYHRFDEHLKQCTSLDLNKCPRVISIISSKMGYRANPSITPQSDNSTLIPLTEVIKTTQEKNQSSTPDATRFAPLDLSSAFAILPQAVVNLLHTKTNRKLKRNPFIHLEDTTYVGNPKKQTQNLPYPDHIEKMTSANDRNSCGRGPDDAHKSIITGTSECHSGNNDKLLRSTIITNISETAESNLSTIFRAPNPQIKEMATFINKANLAKRESIKTLPEHLSNERKNSNFSMVTYVPSPENTVSIDGNVYEEESSIKSLSEHFSETNDLNKMTIPNAPQKRNIKLDPYVSYTDTTHSGNVYKKESSTEALPENLSDTADLKKIANSNDSERWNIELETRMLSTESTTDKNTHEEESSFQILLKRLLDKFHIYNLTTSNDPEERNIKWYPYVSSTEPTTGRNVYKDKSSVKILPERFLDHSNKMRISNDLEIELDSYVSSTEYTVSKDENFHEKESSTKTFPPHLSDMINKLTVSNDPKSRNIKLDAYAPSIESTSDRSVIEEESSIKPFPEHLPGTIHFSKVAISNDPERNNIELDQYVSSTESTTDGSVYDEESSIKTLIESDTIDIKESSTNTLPKHLSDTTHLYISSTESTTNGKFYEEESSVKTLPISDIYFKTMAIPNDSRSNISSSESTTDRNVNEEESSIKSLPEETQTFDTNAETKGMNERLKETAYKYPQSESNLMTGTEEEYENSISLRARSDDVGENNNEGMADNFENKNEAIPETWADIDRQLSDLQKLTTPHSMELALKIQPVISNYIESVIPIMDRYLSGDSIGNEIAHRNSEDKASENEAAGDARSSNKGFFMTADLDAPKNDVGVIYEDTTAPCSKDYYNDLGTQAWKTTKSLSDFYDGSTESRTGIKIHHRSTDDTVGEPDVTSKIVEMLRKTIAKFITRFVELLKKAFSSIQKQYDEYHAGENGDDLAPTSSADGSIVSHDDENSQGSQLFFTETAVTTLKPTDSHETNHLNTQSTIHEEFTEL